MAKKKQSDETGLAVGIENLYFDDGNPPRVGVVAAIVPEPAPDEAGASPEDASSSDGEVSDHPTPDDGGPVIIDELPEPEDNE